MKKEKPPVADGDGNVYFDRLTKAQENAMNHVAFHGHATSVIPKKETLQSLVALGLIVEKKRKTGSGWSAVTVTEYDMPLHVHMAWCFHADDRA